MGKKFSLKDLMSEQSKAEVVEAIQFKVVMIDRHKIIPSPKNKYSLSGIEELAESIELLGLLHNLVVRPINDSGKYELVSGERRYSAMNMLAEKGVSGYEKFPCKIERESVDIFNELKLIFANKTARELTDYERTYQTKRIKEILTELRSNGKDLSGRTRDIIASLLKVSPAQVGIMERIDNNLSEEFKDEFKSGHLNITTAYEISKLDHDTQDVILEVHTKGVPITSKIVKEKAKEITQKKAKPQQEKHDDFAKSSNVIVTKIDVVADHELKIDLEPFEAVLEGVKTFEYRLNDRGFRVGHRIRLNEYSIEHEAFTGRYVDVVVIYILEGGCYGVPEDYCIMSIKKY